MTVVKQVAGQALESAEKWRFLLEIVDISVGSGVKQFKKYMKSEGMAEIEKFAGKSVLREFYSVKNALLKAEKAPEVRKSS